MSKRSKRLWFWGDINYVVCKKGSTESFFQDCNLTRLLSVPCLCAVTWMREYQHTTQPFSYSSANLGYNKIGSLDGTLTGLHYPLRMKK